MELKQKQLDKEIEKGTKFLAANCAKMKKLITQKPACSLFIQDDLYYYLSKAIVSQQLSVKAAATIFERWEQAVPGKVIPNNVLKMDDETCRAAGLSRQKTAYLKNIATYWKANKVFVKSIPQQSNEIIIEELSSIKGVGVWTVQMLLMFALGRLNVYPTKDLGILYGLQKTYGLPNKPSKEQFAKPAKKWGEYSTIACWYLWRSLE